jgi:hypothetical protein
MKKKIVSHTVVDHLLKIGLWRKDNTTSTHYRFSNESSNLKRAKTRDIF